MNLEEKNGIEEIIKKRSIASVFHFTQASNLVNIMKYGLMPRTIMEEQGIQYAYNDDERFDGHRDAICLSVEFPNYKMFYKLRQDNLGTVWCVIELSSKVLADFDCAFSWTNAADSRVTSIPLDQRKGAQAFESIFDETFDGQEYSRAGNLFTSIPPSNPTNPQAEVLLFGVIPVSYIKTIHFEVPNSREDYNDIVKPIEIVTGTYSEPNEYFNPRRDYRKWK